jgi:hypothetical protein
MTREPIPAREPKNSELNGASSPDRILPEPVSMSWSEVGVEAGHDSSETEEKQSRPPSF